MRHIKHFNENKYKAEWMKPGSPIREELELNLYQMLVWLKDYGYRVAINGWVCDNPFIWIRFNKNIGKDQEVLETIDTIKDYLTNKGFKVWREDINKSSQTNHLIYIHFEL